MNKITPPKAIIDAWKQVNGLASFAIFALRTVVYVATIGFLNLFPRAKRSIYEFIIKDVNLNNRSVESRNSYSQEVNRVTKLRIIVCLKVMNKVFETTIGRKNGEVIGKEDLIQYDESDSIESLANKALDGYLKIRKKKLMTLYSDISSKIGTLGSDLFKETFFNGVLCWLTLQNVYAVEKKPFAKFEGLKNGNSEASEQLNSTFKKASKNLIKIKEHYFSVFRTLMDPSLDLESKIETLIKYYPKLFFGIDLCRSLRNSSDQIAVKGIESLFFIVQIAVKDLTEELSRVQDLLECLNAIKNAPKTLENLKKARTVLKNYDQEYLDVYNPKTNKQNPNWEHRRQVKEILSELDEVLRVSLIRNSFKKNGFIDKHPEQIKNKKSEKTRQVNQIENSSSAFFKTNPVSKTTRDVLIEVKNRKIKNIGIGVGEKNKSKQIKTSEKKINIQAKEEKSDDEDLDDIKIESNVLMEKLREFFEHDRAEKRRLKAEKLNTNSRIIEQNVNANSLNQISGSEGGVLSIKIEVDGLKRKFRKIEGSVFNQEVWGVIIADKVINEKLDKYKNLLSTGKTGGGIRQLKGFSDCYEIGTTMDSRLIGKMYKNSVYEALQNFMKEESALLVSQKFQEHGVKDDISLIVFSKEAKKHEDINDVAKSMI